MSIIDSNLRDWSKAKSFVMPIFIGASSIVALAAHPETLHAEPSIAELAAKIEALETENHKMKSAIAQMQSQAKHTQDKIRIVARAKETYAPPTPGPTVPVGGTPVFVTADKRLQFGAITITPGGFIAAESSFRTRTTQGDATAFAAIPFSNSPLAHMNELRMSARQSRAALLVQAPISSSVHAAAYAEFDFLGAAHTANNIESDSYNPRTRNLYATLDLETYGIHMLAGQSWTLATLNSRGITPRNEVVPPVIEAQFVPGFVWTRQPQIRLTKDFNRKLWISISAEESQTSFANCTPGLDAAQAAAIPGVAGVTCQALPQGSGGFLDTTTNYSLNHLPDVIAKVAAEPTFGNRDIHLEAFGMYRDLYDRVSYAGGTYSNQNTTAFGVGAGLIAPVIPKRLDFQASTLVGRGVGRYGTSTLPDATLAPNGALKAIPEAIFMSGITVHATPAIDVYGFGGFERESPTYFSNGAGGFYGVGAPNADDSGCSYEGAPGGCAGNTKQIWQLTSGFWDRLYEGNFGEVRAGVQYSYTRRDLFASTVGGISYAPKANESVVLTSLIYYPFQ